MVKFLVRALFGGLGLWAAEMLVEGISFDSSGALVVAALLLGVVNAILRPILFFLTLPLTVITLGLFLLVLNAAMIGLVGWFLPGMQVDGLVPGILAAIITGVASWIGHMVIGGEKRD